MEFNILKANINLWEILDKIKLKAMARFIYMILEKEFQQFGPIIKLYLKIVTLSKNFEIFNKITKI